MLIRNLYPLTQTENTQIKRSTIRDLKDLEPDDLMNELLDELRETAALVTDISQSATTEEGKRQWHGHVNILQALYDELWRCGGGLLEDTP